VKKSLPGTGFDDDDVDDENSTTLFLPILFILVLFVIHCFRPVNSIVVVSLPLYSCQTVLRLEVRVPTSPRVMCINVIWIDLPLRKGKTTPVF